jgi:hypothetical protein
MFRHPVRITAGEVVERDGFVFADLLPANETEETQRTQRSAENAEAGGSGTSDQVRPL